LQPAAVSKGLARRRFRGLAGCKPAIRQTGGLRYERSAKMRLRATLVGVVSAKLSTQPAVLVLVY